MPGFQDFKGASKAETPQMIAAAIADRNARDRRRAQQMQNLMGGVKLGSSIYDSYVADNLRGGNGASEATSPEDMQTIFSGQEQSPGLGVPSFDPYQFEAMTQEQGPSTGDVAKTGISTALMSSGNPYAMAAGALLQFVDFG